MTEVVSPNGAGKITTVNLLLGLEVFLCLTEGQR